MRSMLPGLPCDDTGPVFKAPWEAQAFAIAVSLHEHGAFSWKEWAEAVAEVIGELRQRGEPDTGEQYYRHWLTALERIATRKGLVSDASLQTRRELWAQAARATPHGQPIELER
jgi:nitrile hydratase accessory protein